MAAKSVLQLAVTLVEGEERACAEHLAARIQERHWAILAALAAELVALHESKNQAARVVLVQADQVETLLADLARK